MAALASPPPAMVAAILCGILVPLLLILLGKVPALREPGIRYRTSVLLSWLTFLIALFGLALAHGPDPIIDYLAGTAVLIAATVTAFIAWSLLAWGFTLSMLLVLASEQAPLDPYDWVQHYTGGDDIRRLTANRAAVLLAARFAEAEANGYKLTRFGKIAALLVGAGRWTFGIRDA